MPYAKPLGVALLSASLLVTGTVANAGSLIAINLMRNATTTPAANDGTEYGISTWVDTDASAGGPIVVDGVTVNWGSSNTWGGGGNNVENGYLDNLDDISVSGLSAWLAANSAVDYTVQLIQATDTDGQWFGNTLISDTSGGSLLHTLTNSNLRRGPSSVSIPLSSDTLFIDPTTGGTPPDGGTAARRNVAGLIITANAVPEPTSAALLGAACFGFVLLRRRL